MGCIYRRKVKQPDGSVKETPTWWIKYSRNGRPYFESSHSAKKEEARRLLRLREGDIARGVPVTSRIGRMRFEEAAKDFLTDYRVNKRKSLSDVERNIKKHLARFFSGRRMVSITTADVRHYASARQQESAANGTINRELAALRRMFRLAIQAGKLMHGPYIALLHENNVRRGFFEWHQFNAVRGHLPEDLRGLVTFSYVTGWRVRSEILPLMWPQVDRLVGDVHLEPGTTKNEDGRTFPYGGIDELREVIEEQWRRHEALRRDGIICPWVFCRTTGRRKGQPIKNFRRAWVTACRKAGCPGLLRHDFRRTAVRNLDRSGVGQAVAMTLVGHKTASIYRRYNITSDADRRDAAAKLNAAMVTKKVTRRGSA